MVKTGTTESSQNSQSPSQGRSRWQREMKIVFDFQEMERFFDSFIPLDPYQLFSISGDDES
ncbi:hypothetical protein KAI87_08685 [Myxococcota bacterium]|nr:hypothetical protein [Myxococcota bacterium]